jgi:hypothetical protein
MRGPDPKRETLFSYVSLESRIPVKRPLRPIRAMISEALAQMDQTFERRAFQRGRHDDRGLGFAQELPAQGRLG